MQTGRLGSKSKNHLLSAPGAVTKNKLRTGQNLPSISGGLEAPALRKALYSTGPRHLGMGFITQQASGPGEPPAGFVGGTTSKTEWYFYWALTKVLGPEGEKWNFQKSMMGGRRLLGGAVVDFIIYQPRKMIGVRIVTYQFHFNVDASQRSHDYEQRIALEDDDFIVVDVYEQDYIHDKSGQAAITLALEVINRRERPNPLVAGYIVGRG